MAEGPMGKGLETLTLQLPNADKVSSTTEQGSAIVCVEGSGGTLRAESQKQKVNEIVKMAEGPDPVGKGLEKLTQEITCPVCHDLFQEPKILPCLHYYCKSCVEQVAARAGQGQPFPCPECRKDVTLPQSDASRLPTAFFVNRMRTVHETMEKAQGKVELTCEQCHSADAKAQAFCRHCAQFICEFCEEVHRRVKAYSCHVVVKLEELQRNTSENLPIVTAPPMLCSEHEEPLKIYCLDCGQLICHYCSAIEHKSHRYEFVKKYAVEVKQTLTDCLLPLRTALAHMSAASAHVQDKKVSVSAQGEVMEQSINEAFDRIIQAIEQRRVQMVGATRKALGEKLDKLAAQEKSFGMLHAEAESLPTFADHSLSSASEGEILSVHKQILQRVDETRQTLESIDLQPTDEPTLTLQLPNADKVSSTIEQGSAVVSVEGVRQAETKKVAKITVSVRPYEVCSIKAKLCSMYNNSVAKVTIVAKGKGIHEVSYRPLVRGRHRLSICLNGEPSDIQIPVFVKHPPSQKDDPVRSIKGLGDPWYCCISGEQLLATAETEGTVVSVDRRASGDTAVMTVVTGLKGPLGIATDQDGLTYVTEEGNSRVQVFDKQWKVVRTLDKVGTQQGELSGPCGIAIGSDQRVYVCDRGNGRVQVFDKNLHHIQSLVPGVGEKFENVLGVAVDVGNNVYVADCDTNTVYTFNKDGRLVSTTGKSAHTLDGPIGLCVQDEYLYVVENRAEQVSVYTLDGKYVSSFRHNSLPHPWGIARDDDGFVYVCDLMSSSVKVF